MILQRSNSLKLGLTACIAFGLVLLILLFPQRSLEAALNGLSVWLDIVLPALLPFFIVSEIMIGLGLVDFISVLLNPIMKPLFRCPGNSSFIWVMSITSGYPMGAKLVSSFYQAGKISKEEGQRILSFCSTSGPLFMIGAVGIGMLASSQAGRLIAFSHYSSAIILGLIYRFYSSPKPESFLGKSQEARKKTASELISQAFQEMASARKRDGRSFGALMGDAVRNSMNAQFLIGGFIVLFSVILNLLLEIGLIQGIANALQIFIPSAPHLSNFIHGICAGVMEVTMGCKLVSDSIAPFSYKLVAISFLIGWSGFSINSQAAGLLAKTPISIPTYLLTKLGHGIVSALITWAMVTFYYKGDVSVFYSPPAIIPRDISYSRLDVLSTSGKFLLVTIIALVILSLSSLILMHLQSCVSKKNRSN